jgi:hypothetical protein
LTGKFFSEIHSQDKSEVPSEESPLQILAVGLHAEDDYPFHLEQWAGALRSKDLFLCNYEVLARKSSL